MPRPALQIIFSSRVAVLTNWSNGFRKTKKITFGCFIDLDHLALIAGQASRNKSRKSKMGPLTVEVHSVEEYEAGQVSA